jgi:hypothetical protein
VFVERERERERETERVASSLPLTWFNKRGVEWDGVRSGRPSKEWDGGADWEGVRSGMESVRPSIRPADCASDCPSAPSTVHWSVRPSH